jgi:tetrahydromethanopterin S-methyltransferase subunit G
MAENLDNLELEHLRHIRGKVDQIADDVSEVKHRLTSVEGNIGGLKRNDANQQYDIYHQNAAIDAIKERLQRIENRLELA